MAHDLILKNSPRNFARGVAATDLAIGIAGGTAFAALLAAVLLPRARRLDERAADIARYQRTHRRGGPPTMEMPAITMDQVMRHPWSPVES